MKLGRKILGGDRRTLAGLLVAAVCVLSGCVSEPVDSTADALQASASDASSVQPRIGPVFFAQHHVLEPSSPYFKLVGELNALVKAQVCADEPVQAPYVFAVLRLGDRQKDIRLSGPDVLPKPYTGDPVLMPHRYDDSFTAMIPAEWIKPGLDVTIELREYRYASAKRNTTQPSAGEPADSIRVLDRKVIGPVNVGAPVRLTMNLIDLHFFGRQVGVDFPAGWEQEFKDRYPLTELVVHRERNAMFNTMVWLPHGGSPSVRCTSPEEYKEKTGHELDGEQGMSLRFIRALKAAAGREAAWRLYYANYCGVPGGGQAWNFSGCGNINRTGIILHECGHAFSLPHCVDDKKYPYKSTMYGQTPGEATGPNAGPTWGFDLTRRDFLPAYQKTEAGYEWTRDPMNGGGEYPGPKYLFKHFSDYNVLKMYNNFENRLVVWNEQIGEYAKWNPETRAYDAVVKNDGLQLPIERDVEVISVLVTSSLVVSDGSIVYPPIGPYTAGLIRRFDADSVDDRAAAQQLGFVKSGCNVCVRVTQGGKVTTYLLDSKVSDQDNPLKDFHVAAINLPARDGDVTHVELLYTPDVLSKGVGAGARVLAEWRP